MGGGDGGNVIKHNKIWKIIFEKLIWYWGLVGPLVDKDYSNYWNSREVEIIVVIYRFFLHDLV